MNVVKANVRTYGVSGKHLITGTYSLDKFFKENKKRELEGECRGPYEGEKRIDDFPRATQLCHLTKSWELDGSNLMALLRKIMWENEYMR